MSSGILQTKDLNTAIGVPNDEPLDVSRSSHIQLSPVVRSMTVRYALPDRTTRYGDASGCNSRAAALQPARRRALQTNPGL